MTKHQMPNEERDRKNQSTQGDRQAGPRENRSDTQRMGSNESQQRQSPGRGDEGKGRDSGGDRR
ncbi:hypothetical protein ACFPOA_02340 [Lysobacter niabensis]|uniref:hypothetical protein n=1 Tax=Agrilutibacter niabensis TaxID=380628 RepID=UPI0036132DB5